jgi:hypothetical protein
MSGSLPVIMTAAGAVPTPPATLLSTLIAGVAAVNPGYTATLPGALIEDIASTDVGAMVAIDQARVDAINSVTPLGANAFVLAALGQQFGIRIGLETNTSVYVVFTGSVGYVIPAGFVVSDGTYQYVVQGGGAVLSTGSTSPIYAVASASGSWAVAPGTVTQLKSSVASGYTLSVTNPLAGFPGGAAETVPQYQARVLQAGLAPAAGVPNALKTALQAVPGVVARLVAVRQVAAGWEVICGGGDPYAVAYAIYSTVLNISTLGISTVGARNATASIFDAPDIYNVSWVIPPAQVVTITAAWNTNLVNFTAGIAVNQLGAPALAAYINSIPVGQPINLLEATAAFQAAVASVLPTISLTTLVFAVTINGSAATPTAGTSIIPSDPESYFSCSASGAIVVQ